MKCNHHPRFHFYRLGGGAWLMLAAMVCIAMPAICRGEVPQQNNLLVNGDLSQEAPGRLPLGWKTFALPGCGSRFDWRNDPTTGAEIEIRNSQPNEARITQAVTLEPGSYRLSAEVRTEEVSKHSGAFLYIAPENNLLSLTTSPTRGTRNWRRIDLLFRTITEHRGIVVGCRLGLPDSPATGTALFRGLSLIRVSGPSEAPAYADIDRLWQIDTKAKPLGLGIPSWGTTRSTLGFWGVGGFFGLLIFIALIGWRLFDDAPSRGQ